MAFKGKKAAPFKKGGGRKKSSTKTAKGKTKKGTAKKAAFNFRKKKGSK